MKLTRLFVSVLFVALISGAFAQSPVFWGLSYGGGSYLDGTLFSFNVPAGNLDVHHSFGGTSDGRNPEGSLIRATNGLLYGTVTNGEAGGGHAVLFSYELSTGTYTILHNFTSGVGARLPRGRLLQASNGLIYGTTQWGGTYGKGTIFSYDIATGTYTELYGFGNTNDAIYPNGDMIQATDGKLYGTTRGDGIADHGSIFSYDINTQAYTKLINFTSLGCFHPQGGLFQASDGELYGLARDNFGSTTGGQGELYQYSIVGNSFTSLHVFGNSLPGTSTTDGCYPNGAVIQGHDGKLYGLTAVGGQHYTSVQGHYSGVLFSYDFTMPPMQRYQVLYHFGGTGDAAQPWGTPLLGSDSALYFMTYYGGAYNQGTIFKYDINAHQGTVLQSLGSVTGYNPKGNLLEDNEPALSAIPRLSQPLAGLQIAPNPATGLFSVILPQPQQTYTAEVYDLLGNKVYAGILNGTNTSINLSNQANGFYFVCLYNNYQRAEAKVLICR